MSDKTILYGLCTISGPKEDVAFILRHLPDVDDKENSTPQPAQAVPQWETAEQALKDREHAEAYYRQAEALLTGNEQTLNAEIKRLRALLAAPQPEAQPQWQSPAKRLVQWLHCMSYNDSYFGEPAGYLKQCVNEMKHLLPPNEVPAAPSAQAEQKGSSFQ